jgi:osmotically-inducible protein OsmY
VERALEERAEVNAAVEVTADALVLSGRVDTAEARQAAEDIALELAGDRRVENDLEVEGEAPVTVADFDAGGTSAGDLPDTRSEITRGGGEIDPDFTDQRLHAADPDSSTAVTGSDDPETSPDTEVFFPPTDPVVTTNAQGDVEVLGGFSPSSTSSVGVARSALDGSLGDEAIADAIRRELREDALTTDLSVDVEVRQGVAYLRGAVPALQDSENAEAVANRVPGVTEVVEELQVAALEESQTPGP